LPGQDLFVSPPIVSSKIGLSLIVALPKVDKKIEVTNFKKSFSSTSLLKSKL